MGCATSKLDDLPAVALCRERCRYLDEAIRQRYAFADAHMAYLTTLKGVAHSMHVFLDSNFDHAPLSPVLNLTKLRENDPGHLSEEDSDGSESGKLHDSGHTSPSHRIEFMNYMKNTTAAPAVVYEQRHMSHETVQVSESPFSFYPYLYPSNNASPFPYYAHPGYGGEMEGSGRYGYSSPAPVLQYTPSPAASSAQESRKPPSPPRSWGWDYLDLFGASYEDNFYEYTPGRNSRDVREDEGIPDLEYEVVKEDPKFIETGNLSRSVAVDEEAEGHGGGGEAAAYQKKPTIPEENNNVADADRKTPQEIKPKTFDGINEVVKEIEIQFERASESGTDIAAMLEVGKFPYRKKSEGSFCVNAPPSEASPSMSADVEVGIPSKTLSFTLHKLYLWEKKLCNEVKAEEKMRVLHDRKVKKLKRLDQKGSEPAKIDANRTFIRKLSTKMRIAIQVVDKISITINKIRDEELWPQLNELIQGLTRMWRSMLECHKIQTQAIGIGSIGSGRTLSDTHLEATLQLEADLINWTTRFANWVSSQHRYVKSLNGWLSKCLLYEPEELPGRIDTPPIFIICNKWNQSLDTVSEKEVLDAMRVFVSSVLQLWRQDKHEMKERMLGNKDSLNKLKNLEKKDVQIEKAVQALEKKEVIFTPKDQAEAVYPGDACRNLQSSLQKIFESMEKFMDSSFKVYEDLLRFCEEEERINVERRMASLP